ncbi:hypothetical protein ACFU90_14690 [Streptomyces noursei]|uniref:hypothetical protein n=1 Tax=Streptomyces noursei TaxID=1971 RepID=UPI00045EF2C1|nr:hypothetical protein [Streptomyces noursei]AIA00667.1 hypothetical protein DC74_139 [Streptomyces noursei]
MPQPTPDDEFFSAISALGATVNAARDEGLPPAVREVLGDLAAEQAADISRNHGTGGNA